jgi:hypothetical protein
MAQLEKAPALRHIADRSGPEAPRLKRRSTKQTAADHNAVDQRFGFKDLLRKRGLRAGL